MGERHCARANDLRFLKSAMLTTLTAEADILRSCGLSVASFITMPVTFSGLVEVLKALGKFRLEIVELSNGRANP